MECFWGRTMTAGLKPVALPEGFTTYLPDPISPDDSTNEMWSGAGPGAARARHPEGGAKKGGVRWRPPTHPI